MSKNDYKCKVGKTAIVSESPPRENTYGRIDGHDELGQRQKLLPTRSNLKFDEQEEMISAFKE